MSDQFRILSASRSSVYFRLADRSYAGSRYFFNVISKLENLSGVATIAINLQRQSDRELLDILFVRNDVWLHWEQRRRRRRTCDTATDRSSKYVSLSGPRQGLRELEDEKLTRTMLCVRFRAEVLTQHYVATCSATRRRNWVQV